MAEEQAYTQAATTGKYDKASGLLGKYDNVRRFWEDQMTGMFLRPALNELVNRKVEHLQRIRILDLGCGNGDGFDLVMGVATKDPGIYEFITAAITPDLLQAYVGVDINEELLCQAKASCSGNPKMCFFREDLSNGLTQEIRRQAPFDLYFSSYGTWSHFHDAQAVKLIADIAEHAPDRALIVGDWLGRWSYEWQNLWDAPLDEEYFMDYRISYIYPEEKREKVDVSTFALRLMCRDEIQGIIEKAEEMSGCRIHPIKFFDRSIMVGRHLDTGDYNAHSPCLRHGINSLFEGYTRTDLESLLVDHIPRKGFDQQNTFFESFFTATNTLVQYTMSLLAGYDADKGQLTSEPPIRPYYPEPLKEAMSSMKRVINGVGWLPFGDVRANVIEPHLGYSLRKLEMELQPGIGVGHGLVGIFEVRK